MPIDRGRTIISRNPEITAYEIATANGFVGTEAEWLTSLVGVPIYKVYTALLTQTGTDTPVATVLENTLGGTVNWIREGVGLYSCTLNGAFIANKTWTSALYNGSSVAPKVGAKLYRFDNNFVVLEVFNDLEVALELETEYPLSIEIRVYP